MTIHEISVNDGILSIPRFCCKPHSIPFREIKSIEKYSISKTNSTALIGRFNNSPIFIDKIGFSTADDFDEFVSFVERCASENRSVEFTQSPASIAGRSDAKSQCAIIIISLTWLVSYALVCTSGINEISESAIAHGALTKDTFKLDELYRIPSSFFLHLNPFHLGLNVLTFAIISRNIEIILGRARLLNILILSAVSGALLSCAFSSYSAVIGASGGILGLLGAYFVMIVRYPQRFPGSISVSRRSITLLLTLQLISDIIIPGIDALSHVGGLLFGVVYAYLITRFCTAVNCDSTSPVEIRVALGASFLYIAGLVYFFSLYFDLL
ncbi:MAG: rhomboid family intramembrane serine protease [Pseudomonadota bacterium]